jgi:protein involved in polysaccharide export with SLBB domain
MPGIGGSSAHGLGIMRASTAILLLALLCGCASRPQQASVAEPLLRSGDCLLFHVQFDSSSGIRRVVNSTGDVSLPDIGKLHVAGMTVEQVSQAIMERYLPRVVHRIEVSRCSQ